MLKDVVVLKLVDQIFESPSFTGDSNLLHQTSRRTKYYDAEEEAISAERIH